MSYPEQQMQNHIEAGNAMYEELERVRDELSAALAQNAELVAQVEAYRATLEYFVSQEFEWNNPNDSMIDDIHQLLEITPTQHLRDVRAEVVSKFCAKLSESIVSVPVPEYGYEHNIKMRNAIINVISSATKQYAESVRDGE